MSNTTRTRVEQLPLKPSRTGTGTGSRVVSGGARPGSRVPVLPFTYLIHNHSLSNRKRTYLLRSLSVAVITMV